MNVYFAAGRERCCWPILLSHRDERDILVQKEIDLITAIKKGRDFGSYRGRIVDKVHFWEGVDLN